MGRARIEHNNEYYYETDENGRRVRKSYSWRFTPTWLKIAIWATIIIFVGYLIVTIATQKDITEFPTDTPIVLTQEVEIRQSVVDRVNDEGKVVNGYKYSFKIEFANTQLKDINNIVIALLIEDDVRNQDIIKTKALSVTSDKRYYDVTENKTVESPVIYKVVKVFVSIDGAETYEPELVERKIDSKFHPYSIIVFLVLIAAFSGLQRIYRFHGRIKLQQEELMEQEKQREIYRENKKQVKAKKVCNYCGQINNHDSDKCEGCGARLQ